MQANKKLKKKESDEESSDDYELPADSFYESRFVASAGSRQRTARVRNTRKQMTDEQMDKMIEKSESEEEQRDSVIKSESKQDDEEMEAEETAGQTKQDSKITLQQYVFNPLDSVVETILFDRIRHKPNLKELILMKKQAQKDEQRDQAKVDEAIEQIKAESSDEEEPQVEEFLVKFKGLSYLNCKWLTEEEFLKCSYQCQQKLKRYKIKKDKLAAGLIQAQPDQNLEPGEFFDPHYKVIDKVITTTNLFPIIHPRQAKNVAGTWRERCILILQSICAYKSQGLAFAAPFMFLRTDERAVMDFTTINNRLYTIPSSSMVQQAQTNPQKQPSFYSSPDDFWNDLGQVFIESKSCYTLEQKEGVFVQRLRELAYYFYLAWRDQISKLSQEAKVREDVKGKNPLEELQQLVTRKTALEQQIKQQQMTAMASAQHGQALQQLIAASQGLIKQIQALGSIFESFSPSPEIESAPDKVQALAKIKEMLPKYISTLLYEQKQNGQGQAGGLGIVPGASGDPASYKHFIIQSLACIIPPELSDKEKEKIASDRQKELEQNAPHGTLILGSEFLTKLGSGEADVLKKQASFSWLLKPNETIEEIVASKSFEKQYAADILEKGATGVDPLIYVKWQNLSYLDCTWEHASVVRACDESDSKIKDFERFNRSLDNSSRQKMMGFSYAHKQILKIFSKKLSAGRKLDHRSAEEAQTREMLSKLLKFEGMNQQQGYFQYDFENNLVPQFRCGQKMKDYQILGLNWMLRAFQDNRNIVLADEMGLGKTVQSISLLDHLIKICKIRGPFLIIAPLSTLDHWKFVAETWTYMNVVVYHDRNGQEGRNEISKQDWYFTDVTNKGTVTQKSKLIKFNLMITSYEVFNQDLESVLKEVPFQYVVVDEAHRLKNKSAKTLVLLKEHPCRRILLLTGTPIQNNTKELFTLLNYIEPDKFNDFDRFMLEYGNLKSADQIERLHKILKPHFLRRLKDEVEFEIPPLKETVVDVGLTPIQQTYYKGIYGENIAMLATLGSSGSKSFNFNNIDMQLRKCCNHLYLLKGVEEEITKHCRTEQDILSKMLDGSGKMHLLDKFIEKYRSENHKMLVFSQFKGMIDIIKEYLIIKGIRHEILTGSIKSQDRMTAIQRFNEDDEFGIFLLTTRAGGLGINLTKARVVVIFDSDWNPQNDLQAIARAHRIGQKFEVEVYRFITARTYEQQMFDRASKKLGMEQALFQKGAFGDSDQNNNDLNKINPEEVEKLLKYGAYAFMDDEENEAEKEAKNIKIEDILKGRDKKKEKKAYTLQKTSFNVTTTNDGSAKDSGRTSATKAAPKEKLSINDPNFWEKVLPFDGYNPKQLARKLRSNRVEILATKESQQKFMTHCSDCVEKILEARTKTPSFQIDEEIYELLKRIGKTKGFELKHKNMAAELLDKLLHFNEYTIYQDTNGDVQKRGHLQRSASIRPKDYTATVKISGRKRTKRDQSDDNLEAELEQELDGIQERDEESEIKPGGSLEQDSDQLTQSSGRNRARKEADKTGLSVPGPRLGEKSDKKSKRPKVIATVRMIPQKESLDEEEGDLDQESLGSQPKNEHILNTSGKRLRK